jgi:hypothetical protein
MTSGNRIRGLFTIVAAFAVWGFAYEFVVRFGALSDETTRTDLLVQKLSKRLSN